MAEESMTACSEERTAQIGDFAIGRLPDEHVEELLLHLDACSECAAYLEVIVGLLRCQDEYGEALYTEERPSTASAQERSCAQDDPDSPLAFFKKMIDRFTTARPLWKTVTAAVPIALVAIITFTVLLPGYYRDKELQALADLTPDSYTAIHLRSDTKDYQSLFDEGMDHYLQENWADAIEKLEMAVELKPDYSMAHYYLGVSYVIERKADKALEHLKRTISLTRSPELREECHWYMAQGHLLKKDEKRALAELALVTRHKGAYELRAKAQEEQILVVLER